MAEQLSAEGQTPREQLRFVVTNNSKDLMFFVQVEELVQPEGGGPKAWRVRKDTLYPVLVYNSLIVPGSNPPQVLPDAELSRLQLAPYGVRAGTRSELWRPISPGDKMRDRIYFMPLKSPTSNVVPDLNSLTRGFYYLGYESKRPPAISRWYALEESYQWRLQGAWAAGESQHEAKLSSTDGKVLRKFTCPGCEGLTLRNDRLEWILPDKPEAARELPDALATITGTAKYRRFGPSLTRSPAQDLEETGSGDLSLLVQTW
jgi:hypothetical protein